MELQAARNILEIFGHSAEFDIVPSKELDVEKVVAALESLGCNVQRSKYHLRIKTPVKTSGTELETTSSN